MSVSLAELLTRDPRDQSDEEFRQIIAALREARSKFILGDQTAGKLTSQQKALSHIKLDIEL